MATVARWPAKEGIGALLERERELREARELLVDAHRQRGRLLLIEAPPGLGKSTLVDHIGALADAEGLRVLKAAGHELERGLGWGVARSLFEPWLFAATPADRDELLSGPAASARILFEADADADPRPASEVSFGILHGLYWVALRLAEATPLLIVVDDAHWADEPSPLSLLRARPDR